MRKKKTAEDAEPEGPPPSPYAKLPVEGDPPPALRNYDGLAELSRMNPEHPVTLDAGVFMWLWRIVENKAQRHYTNASCPPEQLDVALRAVQAFRNSARGVDERMAAVGNGGKKKLIKRG